MRAFPSSRACWFAVAVRALAAGDHGAVPVCARATVKPARGPGLLAWHASVAPWAPLSVALARNARVKNVSNVFLRIKEKENVL